MHIVYIDLLFLINAVSNYLVLVLTSRMGGLRIRRGLFSLAAVFGSGYAVFPVLGVTFLEKPLCKLGAGILMSLIAFGREKRFFRATLLLFGASAALGGMIWAAELLWGNKLTLENGVLYSVVDVRLLLFLIFLSYGILSIICSRIFLHKCSEILEIEIFVRGHTLMLTALMDTGNTLVDSVRNSPVLVVEGSVCSELFPTQIPLEKPLEALQILHAWGETGFRLIPYHAVGVKGGLLLAVRAEKISAGGKMLRDVLVAFSPTPLGDGGRYQALIGGESWNWL